MIFKYSIIPADLVHLNYHSIGEKELNKLRLFVRFFPLLFIIPMAFLRYSFGGEIGGPLAIGYGVIFLLWVIFSSKALFLISERRIGKLFKIEENKWLLGERTMALNEERMIESVGDKLVLNKTYGELNRVEMSDEGIYTFIDEKTSYIMPLRAFKNKEEMEATFKFIERRIIEERKNTHQGHIHDDDVVEIKNTEEEIDKL